MAPHKNILPIKIIVTVLFFFLLFVGFQLSQNKPLWNDEIYSQTASIEGLSYVGIFSGKVNEGSNAPLFYIIQKSICNVTGYRFSSETFEGDWYVMDRAGQFILRVAPNVYMSLAITCMFYFFARKYSWWAGVYAVLVMLSSSVIWGYWVEARPYGLWILLTTIQLLLFISLLSREKKSSSGLWKWLTIIHILQSMTVVLSMVTIVIVSLILFVTRERRWQKYILMTILPVCVCLFYYARAPKFQFWVGSTFSQIVNACVPSGQLVIMLIYTIFLAIVFMKRKGRDKKEIDFMGLGYLASISMAIAATYIVYYVAKMGDSGGAGFELSQRYFIYLTPMGIVATTLFPIHLIERFKRNTWVLINLFIILGGLLILQYLKSSLEVYGSTIFWR